MLSGMPVYRVRTIGDDRPQSLINLVRRYHQDKKLDKLVDYDIKDQIDSRSFDAFREIAFQCISFNLVERPTMDKVIERIGEALNIQEKTDSYIKCAMEDMGFSDHGIPIAAFTIYKCLVHWKYLEADRTTMFDKLIRLFNSATQDEHKFALLEDDKMAYWLTNASTLLFLLQKSLRVRTSHVPLPPPRTSLFGKITTGFRSLEIREAEAELKVLPQVYAKYPAFLFNEQLTESVKELCGVIVHNLKDELRPLLNSCIDQARLRSNEVLSYEEFLAIDIGFDHWNNIVCHLKAHIRTLKQNFMPPVIAQQTYAAIFSYINVELFNSVLQNPMCCTFSYGKYVEEGLAGLKKWCSEAKEEVCVCLLSTKTNNRSHRFFLILSFGSGMGQFGGRVEEILGDEERDTINHGSKLGDRGRF